VKIKKGEVASLFVKEFGGPWSVSGKGLEIYSPAVASVKGKT
jgi:hypothetical protein